MRNKALRELCILSVFAALLLILKEVMAALPNIEGVSLLIVLCTIFFGWKALLPVAVFIVIEGILYGFGFWFPFYCIIWPLLVALTMLFRKLLKARVWAWAVFLGLFGLLFGMVYALTLFPTGGWSLVWSAYGSGMTFDLLHAGGNLVLAAVLFFPLYRILQRLTTRNEAPIIKGE